MHMSNDQVAGAAKMVVDVAVGVDQGDRRKMIAFAIDEFAIVLGGSIRNVEDLAAIIDEATDQLHQRVEQEGRA